MAPATTGCLGSLVCKIGTTKVAVVGKTGAGKTYLIEALQDICGYQSKFQKKQGYSIFSDIGNRAEWYDVNGIEFEIDTAHAVLKDLIKGGIETVIYCFDSSSGKVEEKEAELIKKIEEEFSKIKILIVLTKCIAENENIKQFMDVVSQNFEQIKVLPILAKDYQLRIRGGESVTIKAFGIDEVIKYVFEGR